MKESAIMTLSCKQLNIDLGDVGGRNGLLIVEESAICSVF